MRFKTCRLLSGNVRNRNLTIIQRRILRRLRNKKRSIKRKIYPRKNLNSYIQLQTTRKLPLFHGDLPITEMHRGTERASYIPFPLNPETRSDVIPVRLHFRETIPQARQLINHRRVCVNNEMVKINHLKLSHGDIISFQENNARIRGEEIRRFFHIEISVEKIIKISIEKRIKRECRKCPVRMWRRIRRRILLKTKRKHPLLHLLKTLKPKRRRRKLLKPKREHPLLHLLKTLKPKRGHPLLHLLKTLKPKRRRYFLYLLKTKRGRRKLLKPKRGRRLLLIHLLKTKRGRRKLLKSRFLKRLRSFMQEEDLSRTKKFGSKKVCLGSSFAEHNRMKRNLYRFKSLFLSKRRNEKNLYRPKNLYRNSTYFSESPHLFTMTRRIKRIELPTHYSEVNHRTLKAVVSYGPNIGHIPHDIRLKDPNLPLRSGNGRGQNI